MCIRDRPYADEPAGTAYIGKVGATPVYEYYFTALFASYVTEALENEPDYDAVSYTHLVNETIDDSKGFELFL